MSIECQIKPQITRIKTDSRGILIGIIRVILLNQRNPRLKNSILYNMEIEIEFII